ncbi:hypothetical protein [Halovulum sp. GXIMD14793]
MEFIADGLLIAAAGTAALYCWVLSRKLNDLRNLDKGLGGAIASLSAQVDETHASLLEAKKSTLERTKHLSELTSRAEIAAGRLEMLLATVHEGDKARPVPTEKVAAKREARSTDDDLLTALRGLAGVSGS